MFLSTTSILPVAPGPQNDPRWRFANALVKKLAKEQIETEVAKHAPAARRLLFHPVLVDKNPVSKRKTQREKLVKTRKKSLRKK